ncbi:hypothetical protein IE81DRAFT_332697 [Ceraceosorus guamensis]|uniref:Uncharacterized protein n=1 Tax=Ceraceosorus guamensis TaxID=1522189 RepID=A0A316VMS5_9BASI|nr:hypothetical protein IE81DRAFT_332697 [Ceraceosorus guamensis]PWN38929.1 hypothetical protein IE81DRAFT_332697 [Ceraceosorus guamensis]
MFNHIKTTIALAAIFAMAPSLAKTPPGFSDNAERCRENPGVASNCWEQACDSVTGNSARIKLMAPADKVGQWWVECTLSNRFLSARESLPASIDPCCHQKLRVASSDSQISKLDNYTDSAISKTGFHKEA